MQQRPDPARVDRAQGVLAVEHALVDRVDGEADGGERVALRRAGLEDEQPPVLDRVLDVLDVPVVALEPLERLDQLRMDGGHPGGKPVEGLGVADPGNDVLALRVEQEVAVRARVAVGRIAAERDPGAGALAEVAEHHPLHGHRRAEVVGDPV